MRQLLFTILYLSVLTMGKYVCSGKTFLPAAGSSDFGAGAIKNAVLSADTTVKDDDPWIRTEFIPSKFTKDRKIQQELSKFLLHRQWKSDYRELLLQTDKKRFEYFNFKDPEQKIDAFDFADDKIIFAIGEVVNSEEIARLKELTVEQIDAFEAILIKCKLSGFPFRKSDDGEYEYYLCGMLLFDMNQEIRGYIILTKITAYIFGRPSYHFNTYLMIQDETHVSSILELTASSSGVGYGGHHGRVIRVADDLFVTQSELSSDAIIEGTQEEAERLGIKNHAVFKVYEVTKDGYIVGRN